MIKPVREARYLSIDELEVVSGGRLIDAVHQPLTSKPSMSLHMR